MAHRKEKVMTARFRCLALTLTVLGLALIMLAPALLHAQDQEGTITGQVVNGTAGGPDPADLEVTLHVIGNSGEVDIFTTTTDGDGRFRFQYTGTGGDATYALTTSYQDVSYSRNLVSPALAGPVVLTVYETTDDVGVIQVDANVLLIRGADEDKSSLVAFEVLSLVNGGDRTFVPDLAQPANMNFLRFSIPTGTRGLEVSSDLPGGQIVTVGSGFALTAPVTPGPHQVAYTYRVSYSGTGVRLSHSFPMGAETFRFLIADTFGSLRDSDILVSLPPTDEAGKLYRVWGANGLEPGERVNLEIGDLPQPGTLQRLENSLTDGPYLKIGIPSAVGFVLAALLIYGVVFRRLAKATASGTGPELRPGAQVADWPESPLDVDRRVLVEGIARLDDLYEQGGLAQSDYDQRRQELKARLLRLALAAEGK